MLYKVRESKASSVMYRHVLVSLSLFYLEKKKLFFTKAGTKYIRDSVSFWPPLQIRPVPLFQGQTAVGVVCPIRY